MNLLESLKCWDGKSKHDIQAIYDKFCDQKNFLKLIVANLNDESIQIGASWLLKAWFEAGKKINLSQTRTVFNSLTKQNSWQAKLHLLQCISYMSIAEAKEKELYVYLHNQLADENKFVRAWSYNALHLFSVVYPAYADEISDLLKLAMKDEAASVKARIRNILKAKSS